MKITTETTNSTIKLIDTLANAIYNDIKKYGNANKCFKAVDTNYDYTNVVKVDKEADRVIALVDVLGTDEKITTITQAKSMLDTFLDKTIVFKDVLKGRTWKEFQNEFKVEV